VTDSARLRRATKSLRRVLDELKQLTRLVRILGIGQFDTDPAIRHLGQGAWNDVEFSVTHAMPAVVALEQLAVDCDEALSEFRFVRKHLRNVRSDSYELKTVPDLDMRYGTPFVGASAHHVAATIAKRFHDMLANDEGGSIRINDVEAPTSQWAIEFRKRLRRKGVKHVRKLLAQGLAVATQISTFRLSWQVLDRLKDDLIRESRQVSTASTDKSPKSRNHSGFLDLTLRRTSDGGVLTHGDTHMILTARQYWVMKCLADGRQKKDTGGFITRKELGSACTRTPLDSQIGDSHLSGDFAWITRVINRIKLPDGVLERRRGHEVSWRLATPVRLISE
jgi:hypothetical protein